MVGHVQGPWRTAAPHLVSSELQFLGPALTTAVVGANGSRPLWDGSFLLFGWLWYLHCDHGPPQWSHQAIQRALGTLPNVHPAGKPLDPGHHFLWCVSSTCPLLALQASAGFKGCSWMRLQSLEVLPRVTRPLSSLWVAGLLLTLAAGLEVSMEFQQKSQRVFLMPSLLFPMGTAVCPLPPTTPQKMAPLTFPQHKQLWLCQCLCALPTGEGA